MSAWIDIKISVPKKEGRYLVWMEGFCGSEGHMEIAHWFSPLGSFMSKIITHWQELPQHPTPVDSEVTE